MMSVALDAGPLLSDLEDALSRARDGDARRIVSVTVELEDVVDPSAIAAGSRRADDRWFCWERPEAGFALGGIGTAIDVVSRGERRFPEIAEGCSRALRDRVAVEPEGLPAGAGPVWTAGFAFAPDGGSEPIWSSLPPALAVLPEVSIARSGDAAWLTASAGIDPGQSVVPLVDRIAAKDFDSIVLAYPATFDGWYRTVQLGEPAISAIRSNYRLAEEAGGLYFYVPAP